LATEYRIDRFQETYFVLDDFTQLYNTIEAGGAQATVPSTEATIAPGATVVGDVPVAAVPRSLDAVA
jgi:phenylalanine-4-hydroxylase